MLCLRLLQWPSVGARCLHKPKDTTLICHGPFITAKGGFPPLFTSISQICDPLLMTVLITELKLLAIHGMPFTDFLWCQHRIWWKFYVSLVFLKNKGKAKVNTLSFYEPFEKSVLCKQIFT